MSRVSGARRPRGFTLVELLVALLLASILALTAHGLLAAMTDAGTQLQRSAEESRGTVAARTWALEACRSLEAGTATGLGFEGDSMAVRFHSRVVIADGWIERRPVTISVGARRLTLSLGDWSVVLADSVDGAVLSYLADPTAEGGWVDGWSSPVSAPLAIRMRWMRGEIEESLLCPIGARG